MFLFFSSLNDDVNHMFIEDTALSGRVIFLNTSEVFPLKYKSCFELLKLGVGTALVTVEYA